MYVLHLQTEKNLTLFNPRLHQDALLQSITKFAFAVPFLQGLTE